MAKHNASDRKDVFEQKLDAVIAELAQCQNDKKVASCALCDKLLGCELRKRYVSAVYDSMSKGETGGFEF